MAVGGFDIFGRHPRIQIRKVHPVVGKAARQPLCIDHGVFLSSPGEDAGGSADCGAENRLGVASVVLGDVGGSAFLAMAASVFGAFVALAFCRAAFAAAAISAFASAKVRPSATSVST